MESSFDKVHHHYDRFMKFWGLYREEEIRDLLALTGKEVVVDLGGGTGHLAAYLVDECREIYVLDQSPKMLSHVPFHKKIRTICCEALETELADQMADRVILSDVFHHIADQQGLLTEIKRILKPEGLLLIHDFNIENWRTKVLRSFEWMMFGKLYFQNLQFVEELLEAQGFVLEKKVDQGWYYLLVAGQDAGRS